ncbi:MAG: response regulator transcription factor [Clostridiales bacterium]|nr:response regulator transcription factor [Clostridiales bacterium]
MAVLIFATAHEQYMGDAFELYAFDYLLKPFKVERALNTLRLVRERLLAPSTDARPIAPPPSAEPPSRLMLKHREGIHFVDMREILLVQREDRMTVVYAEGEKRFVTSLSMSDLEEKLPKSLFFRCHKSYIVNLNRIDSIAPYGRWTYIVKLRGTKQDALITHERFEALETMYA